MSSLEYSKLINRFYNTATRVMVRSDALIDKIIGDQVAAMYVPGFAGAAHARRAVEAARDILRATGHSSPEGPWIPLGVGVHTGTAFVGAVGSEEGTTDITVLGDAPNTTARLASSAMQGEILISDAAFVAAQMDLNGLEIRQLALKGKTERVLVHVLSGES
jgi:adenylate cyclase